MSEGEGEREIDSPKAAVSSKHQLKKARKKVTCNISILKED